MLTKTNTLTRVSGAAVALVVALAPLPTIAQRAADRAAPPRALEDFVQSDAGPQRFAGPAAINLRTGKVLNEAIAALNAKNYADARAILGALQLDRLSPYERGKTEQILSNIAYGEQKYVEAREHLQKAIDSGGLSEQEVAQARRQIQQIAARIATAPLA
jgi:hypothetical protein